MLVVGVLFITVLLSLIWRRWECPYIFVGVVQLFGWDAFVFLLFLKQVSVGGVSDCFSEGSLSVSFRYGVEVSREVFKDLFVLVVAHSIWFLGVQSSFPRPLVSIAVGREKRGYAHF